MLRTRSQTNTMPCVAHYLTTFPFSPLVDILNTLQFANVTCNLENSDINNNYNDDNDGTDNGNHNENNRNNNNSDGGSSGNGDNSRNERDNEDDESLMNNNSTSEDGNNNNSNGDGNDEKDDRNTVDEDGVEKEEHEDEDEEDESSDGEDDTMNGNFKNPTKDESVKRYLLNKLSYEDIEKSDSRLSIISSTPYDSIEAQSKHNVVDEDVKERFVELINVRGNSLTDEFSGTESMEYMQYNDHEKLVANHENWCTNLIAMHPQQITGDSMVSNSFDSASSHLPDSSEVHVITGNDTLSAVICLEEGLADDDSWVEELDHDDFPDESSDGEEVTYIERVDERYYNRADIDLTLHTIFEESGEDSESEPEKEVDSTQLEKYFVFEIGGAHSRLQNANRDQDSISESVSESSSTISEGLDSVQPEDSILEANSVDLAPSRLEKYFLSGFMGFSKRDSDGSVGSDSESRPSPEQRRKKVIRARGTNRHSSLDNLLVNEEQQPNAESQYESSSSEVEANDENDFVDKNDEQSDTIKRTKKKKRCQVSSIEHLESVEDTEELIASQESSAVVNIAGANLSTIDLNTAEETNGGEMTESIHVPSSTLLGLSRKDSFNNWSSDEETNLMMSKMRTFFKNMIAQRKNASLVNKNRNKPPQLVYFESELTRLMKTVPGLRDDQVKEIVEYLSSEDTWSDSYDSSDYTSSDLDVGIIKKNPFQPHISVDSCKVPDINTDGEKDTDLVYQCLMSSLQRMELNADSSASRNSPPLMNKVMQHIGIKLVALMHEVTEGTASTPKAARYQRRTHSKLPTIATAAEEEDDSVEERSPLPRSKSYDPLLEESRQETSDNERFSWRGSFESALMTGSDSRTRLPSAGENSASALVLAISKRRSAGDLLLKSGNNSREHLDRVRSCGSIGGGIEDKIWSMRHAKKRRSSIPDERSDSGESADGENDSDNDGIMEKSLNENVGKSTTLPRTLQALNTSTTNSLPRLSSSPSPNIYKVNSSHSFGVKSARYRPPGYNTRNSPGSYHTMCAPPRREYSKRKQHQLMATPPSALSSSIGTGDDYSVVSDISERASIMDNELERTHSRISAVSVTRSDSMASVYSGIGEGRYGVVPIRGEVEFDLQYNYKAGDVEIHVKRCLDLAPVDQKRNRSDPYVKVYLLPDKSKSGKRKTRVKKHTLNPVFDEVLKYHITLAELELRTLWLSVWHSDIFGRNDFLGEVIIPLVNKVFDDPSPRIHVLKERSEILDNVSTSKGELIVALKFVLPADCKSKKQTRETGSLHVLVKEAKNLTAAKSNGTSDPFCKSYLLPNKGRTCKQKTPILKRTCHPVWNHTFVYGNVTLDELSQRCLELTIWDHDRLASNEFLGGVRLSLGTGLSNDKSVDWMDSNNREIALWHRMIDHQNFWVESALILRSSADMRSKN